MIRAIWKTAVTTTLAVAPLPDSLDAELRDVAGRLKADERIRSFVVDAENFESIHNHSAFARISHTK